MRALHCPINKKDCHGALKSVTFVYVDFFRGLKKNSKLPLG